MDTRNDVMTYQSDIIDLRKIQTQAEIKKYVDHEVTLDFKVMQFLYYLFETFTEKL